MAKKPTYDELIRKIEALEKKAAQHKQSTENLLEIERDKYIKLINDSNDAIIIAQGIELKLANKAAFRMWGYRNEEEAAGLTMTDVISPKDLEVMIKRGEARERGEKVPNRYEFRALRKDGTEFLAELSVSNIIYQGKVARQGVIRNITERKKKEAALKESEGRYRSLFNNNHSVMLVIDPKNGDIVDANPAAVAYYGWSYEELITKKITDINRLTREQVFEEMENAKSEQRRHFFFQHRLSNGDIREVEVYSGPIKLHGQDLLYSIIHDITDRKQTEEALREANTTLNVLLKRRDNDQAEIEDKILANVNELIQPIIDSLKQTQLDGRQSTLLDILETNLNDIVSPFSRALYYKYMRLTSMEYQVAKFVRNGKTTKEIGGLLGVAPSTVNTYRDNIRKKLGIKNKKINLKTYLFDLE